VSPNLRAFYFLKGLSWKVSALTELHGGESLKPAGNHSERTTERTLPIISLKHLHYSLIYSRINAFVVHHPHANISSSAYRIFSGHEEWHQKSGVTTTVWLVLRRRIVVTEGPIVRTEGPTVRTAREDSSWGSIAPSVSLTYTPHSLFYIPRDVDIAYRWVYILYGDCWPSVENGRLYVFTACIVWW